MQRIIGLLALLSIAWQPAFAAQVPDTLGKIKREGRITLAYAAESRPFSAAREGIPEGYSIDICRRIVDGIKRQLGLEDLEVIWRAADTTPERLAMVEKGQADLECGTTTITLGRQEKVDFSNQIFVEAGGILVRADSGISSLAGLPGKKVGAIPGTTTGKRLEAILQRKGIDAEMKAIRDVRAGMKALDAGKLHAYAADRIVLIGQVTDSANPSRYAMVLDPFSLDPYGLALPRGDADFRLAVNRALAQVYRNGAIEDIFVRWFTADANPSEMLQAIYLLNAYQD